MKLYFMKQDAVDFMKHNMERLYTHYYQDKTKPKASLKDKVEKNKEKVAENKKSKTAEKTQEKAPKAKSKSKGQEI